MKSTYLYLAFTSRLQHLSSCWGFWAHFRMWTRSSDHPQWRLHVQESSSRVFSPRKTEFFVLFFAVWNIIFCAHQKRTSGVSQCYSLQSQSHCSQQAERKLQCPGWHPTRSSSDSWKTKEGTHMSSWFCEIKTPTWLQRSLLLNTCICMKRRLQY